MEAASHGLEKISYQQELRLLGAYLDHQKPSRFTVIERKGGFDIVMEGLSDKPQREKSTFEHSTLEQQLLQVLGRHRRGRADHGWSLGFGSREDFLRALGYELDETSAYMILLDEIDAAILATYSYIDPAEGYSWRKRWVRLGKDESEQIVKAARDRSRAEQRRKLFGP